MISRLFTANSVQETILMTPHSTGTNNGSIRNDFTNCLFTQSLIFSRRVSCLVSMHRAACFTFERRNLDEESSEAFKADIWTKRATPFSAQDSANIREPSTWTSLKVKFLQGNNESLVWFISSCFFLTLFRNHGQPSCRRYQNDEHIHQFVAYFLNQIPRGWFDPNHQWPWDVWPHQHHGKQQRLVYLAWLRCVRHVRLWFRSTHVV